MKNNAGEIRLRSARAVQDHGTRALFAVSNRSGRFRGLVIFVYLFRAVTRNRPNQTMKRIAPHCVVFRRRCFGRHKIVGVLIPWPLSQLRWGQENAVVQARGHNTTRLEMRANATTRSVLLRSGKKCDVKVILCIRHKKRFYDLSPIPHALVSWQKDLLYPWCCRPPIPR